MTGPVRVAHLLGPSQGGIRRHVRYLASHPPEGVVTHSVRGPADLAPYFRGLPFRASSRLRLPLSGRGADVVHAHGLTAGMAALVPGGPPVVVTLHVVTGSGGRTAGSPFLRGVARVIAGRADVVVAVSDAASKAFPSAVVIPPAVEPLPAARRTREEVRAELGTPPDAVVAITVARLHRDKDLGVFIESVEGSGAEGWIVGDGPERAALAGRARGTTVRLLGYRDDVPDLLEAADLFVLTSRSESYGIAVMEAVAAGLPVVAPRTGAVPDLVNGAGVLVDPGDAQAVIREVGRLVGDASARQALALAARASTHLPDPRASVGLLGEIYVGLVR